MKKTKMPLVSVIMSTYNDEKYIQDAIQSILNQSYDNLELIIINDASTDRTKEILNQIDDSRVQIINNEENCKLAHNLNVAISRSNGKYIARMDADDVAEKNRIARQVQFMENNKECDVLGTYVRRIGDGDGIIEYPLEHNDIKTMLLFENVICHPGVMFRADGIDFKYDERCVAGQDYELWSRIIWTKKFATIPEVLLNYRIHANQTRNKNKDGQKAGAIQAKWNMISHLYVIDSIDEKNIISIMFDYNIKKNPSELKQIETLLNKIINKNEISHVYVQNILVEECAKLYYTNWYISVGKNKVTWASMNKSQFMWFYRQKSILEKTKVIYRVIKNLTE